MISNFEHEVQQAVDAKMKIAATSDVYGRLSDDIKTKSGILAALKATLHPAVGTGSKVR